VDRIKRLEAQLAVHRRIDQLNKRIFERQQEVRTLGDESNLCHQNLSGIAQESQEIHRKMVEKIAQAKELRTQADGFHNSFLQVRERMKPFQEEILTVFRQMEQMKAELEKKERAERDSSDAVLREKLQKQAQEKLRRGEKLTWQEFQLTIKEESGEQE
jgi:uncharacterized coiled-coil DUF342 family protein